MWRRSPSMTLCYRFLRYLRPARCLSSDAFLSSDSLSVSDSLSLRRCVVRWLGRCRRPALCLRRPPSGSAERPREEAWPLTLSESPPGDGSLPPRRGGWRRQRQRQAPSQGAVQGGRTAARGKRWRERKTGRKRLSARWMRHSDGVSESFLSSSPPACSLCPSVCLPASVASAGQRGDWS